MGRRDKPGQQNRELRQQVKLQKTSNASEIDRLENAIQAQVMVIRTTRTVRDDDGFFNRSVAQLGNRISETKGILARYEHELEQLRYTREHADEIIDEAKAQIAILKARVGEREQTSSQISKVDKLLQLQQQMAQLSRELEQDRREAERAAARKAGA